LLAGVDHLYTSTVLRVMVVSDELREVCGWIAGRSRFVRVLEERIASYTLQLGDPEELTAALRVSSSRSQEQREEEAAFWMTLDAVNFGSGWFPTLRKSCEPTGYRTIARGIRRKFDESGAWTPAQLTALTRAELAGWLDQAPEHELVGLFVESLRDLGAHVETFAGLVDAADGSAVSLVETLAEWDCFRDVSEYHGRAVPFLKRAQIVAADLHRAGVAEFRDLGRLTMFADNLVPHVLRLDGVLWFEPELVARIEAGDLIAHGSPEEVEIRACAVHAVELIVAAARPDAGATAALIDEILWNRGQAPEYKAVPRHRSRSTAY
jgi:Potential Queuosine, Q, salvage protein family